MKVTLLGTGTSQGVPVIACNCSVCRSKDKKDKRLRTSALIEWNNVHFVIDTGPDFRLQMLSNNVTDINGIFYTHEHADHTAGLDDIRPLYFKRKIPIPIYANERVINDLKLRFNYIFTKKNRYPGAPEVSTFTPKAYRSYFIEGMEVIPLIVMHGNLPIYGYKIGKMAYITDAKTLPDETKTLIKDLDLLIINALHHKKHNTHMNLTEALELIQELKPKHSVLIHISHHMGLHQKINSDLPPNVELGYDGMQINL